MYILGSRGSDLALWQARHVQALLREQAHFETDIKIIHTVGDRDTDVSLKSLDGKGFFTKEIEAALLQGEIDLAVHSHKDLPTESPSGLIVGAIPPRGNVSDCLLVRPASWDSGNKLSLQEEARVGTGSARRQAQLLAWRPDLQIQDLRGNVPTRVQKLARGEYDAIVVAQAGLERLGLDTTPFRRYDLDPDEFIPAPAQGALAIQLCGAGELTDRQQDLLSALAKIHDESSARRVAAERLLLAALEGGCNLPLGAHAVFEGQKIRLMAFLLNSRSEVRRCVVEASSPEDAAHQAWLELTT